MSTRWDVTHGLFLCSLSGEGPVLERQPIRLAAASNGVARPDVVRQGDALIARRATDPEGERHGPDARLLTNTESVPRAARALQQVTRSSSLGQVDERLAVGALDGDHHRMPRSRCNRPRSNPTTTSSSTVITGTAIRPVRTINFSRAPGSSATFLPVNSMPRDERNSFVVWQDCQVEDQ